MKRVDKIILVIENRHHRGHIVDGLRLYVIDGYHQWRCEVDSWQCEVNCIRGFTCGSVDLKQ